MNQQRQFLQMSHTFQRMADDFFTMQYRYQAAIQMVTTKLEILDEEFQSRHKRNPIHSMQSRLKTVQSMVDKLRKRHLELSVASAVEHLTDIAGVRVVCSYIQDIYTVANLLTAQKDLKVLSVHDYIQNPKPNGYRSLHIVVQVTIYLSDGPVEVPVEVQIRTIAMDFWASLEHSLRYKAPEAIPSQISAELWQTAADIARLDERMQLIHDRVDALAASAGSQPPQP